MIGGTEQAPKTGSLCRQMLLEQWMLSRSLTLVCKQYTKAPSQMIGGIEQAPNLLAGTCFP